jgi:hypothetical protein
MPDFIIERVIGDKFLHSQVHPVTPIVVRVAGIIDALFESVTPSQLPIDCHPVLQRKDDP